MRTLMETIKFAQSQREAIEKIDAIISECTSFKIGKTGERLLDRLNQPDYNDVYTHIVSVFTGTKEDVDSMESYLINTYLNHPKCDNKKDGGASKNDTMADGSEKYQVYVVWK
jgi:hypothetical protein